MSLVPKHIKNLMPYKAGKPISEVKRELNLKHIVKLASNENPMGPSLLGFVIGLFVRRNPLGVLRKPL